MTFETLSPKQRTVFKWAYRPNLYALICDGSVRSGKSASMACAFILWAMDTFNGCRFAICGNTVQSAERNIIMELSSMADITHYFNVSYVGGSKHLLTVSGNGRKNLFHVFGGKDEASYKLVQGITLSGVLFDEVALMPESFVNQAIARTLSVTGAKLWFNCNPDAPSHWFYQNWILPADSGEKPRYLHLHFTMSDNPLMDAEKIHQAEEMYHGVFYNRYILGKWVVAEGVVYPMFRRDTHVIPDTSPASDAACEYYIAIDYGTLNPTAMQLWELHPGGKSVLLRESYHDGRKSTPRTDEEHYRELERLADGLPIRAVIVDPSASSFITCIRRHGMFRVWKANNDVISGIRETSNLLAAGKLLICEGCEDTIREFESYRWDEKAEKDTVIKEFDHAMDAMRYYVRTAGIMRKAGGDLR